MQMVWFRFYLLIFLTSTKFSVNGDESCIKLETCDSCVQNPICGWCYQTNFHGADKKPQSRCNSLEDHGNLGPFQCDPQFLFNHSNDGSIIRDNPLTNAQGNSKAVPIRPQRLRIQVRVKDPISFSLHYKEVVDYPLDLYYLMDGTYTMKDDKEVLESFGDLIGKRLGDLTSQFRLGFGTFVDKVTSPFVATIPSLLENPCAIKKDTCIRPYGFHNHMKLSQNTNGFINIVKAVKLSASSDLPEGGFDALMQVMVCRDQIGWSEQARKLIVFATDAPFHYAGDGRLGGVILPNDGECHMDEHGEFYTHSLLHDYPSMAQINSKAKEHSISIIFAVTADEIRDYRLLTKVVEGSNATELAKNSSNIIDLVEAEYERIRSKVEIKDSFPSEYFAVRYHSNCNKWANEREINTCQGLVNDTEVKFRVEIELIKCPPNKLEWKQQYRIYAVGVPDSVEVDVEMLCDCPCQENKIPNAAACNRRGSEVCGLCECNNNYFGKHCECSTTMQRKDELFSCKPDNSTDVICSGRGTCECGQCNCLNQERFTGHYCECDNSNCNLKDGILCGGNGKCNCGKCECVSGWTGSSCDCSTSRETCIKPGSESECSSIGVCKCGSCLCGGWYSGLYCEKCLHKSCPNECDALRECVQCKIHGSGELSNPADCDLRCYEHNISRVEVIEDTFKSEEVLCKVVDPSDECVVIFSYKLSEDKKFMIKAQESKECRPKAPIFLIVTVVAGIVVVAGLILLCVYLAYQKIQIKREFTAYENERKNAVWTQETNPLYSSPVESFQNPTYMGKQ